jgi:hypothetical protein
MNEQENRVVTGMTLILVSVVLIAALLLFNR